MRPGWVYLEYQSDRGLERLKRRTWRPRLTGNTAARSAVASFANLHDGRLDGLFMFARLHEAPVRVEVMVSAS